MKAFSQGEGGSICLSQTGSSDSWREQYGGGKLPKHDQTVWSAVIFICSQLCLGKYVCGWVRCDVNVTVSLPSVHSFSLSGVGPCSCCMQRYWVIRFVVVFFFFLRLICGDVFESRSPPLVVSWTTGSPCSPREARTSGVPEVDDFIHIQLASVHLISITNEAPLSLRRTQCLMVALFIYYFCLIKHRAKLSQYILSHIKQVLFFSEQMFIRGAKPKPFLTRPISLDTCRLPALLYNAFCLGETERTERNLTPVGSWQAYLSCNAIEKQGWVWRVTNVLL